MGIEVRLSDRIMRMRRVVKGYWYMVMLPVLDGSGCWWKLEFSLPPVRHVLLMA